MYKHTHTRNPVHVVTENFQKIVSSIEEDDARQQQKK